MADENGPSIRIQNSFPLRNIELLYLNEKGADVHFIFNENDERIPAHRVILSSLSSVLDNAFFGSIPEKDAVKINDVGVTASAFKEFLKFFYLKEVILSMEHIHSVIHLCHKYQLDSCFKICLSFLKEYLTIDEICLGYQLAIHYEQNDLKYFCKRKISIKTEDVLKSNGFLNCDWVILNEIVRFAALNCRESVLLKACINWARNICRRDKIDANDKENIRNVLKDAIYEIRFDQFSLFEFTTILEQNPSSPYTEDELDDIKHIMAKERITSTKFNRSSRLPSFDLVPWFDSEKIECHRWITCNADYNISDNSSTIFSSSKSMIIGEFFVYFKPWNQNVLCEISMEEIDLKEVKSKPCFEVFTKTVQNGSVIALPKPVILKKDIKYNIKLNFSTNSIQLKGDLKMKPEVELSNGATIMFHRGKSTDLDIVAEGVIGVLNFNEIKN